MLSNHMRILLCAACTGGLAAGAAPAHAAFPGQNGLIAFESDRDGGDLDIWTMRPNGRNLVNLTPDSAAFDADAKWSADGRKIVFMSDRDGDLEIFTMAADGGHVRQVTFNALPDANPAWSPDGRRLVLTHCPDIEANDCDLWTIGVDGRGARQITNGPNNDRQPEWSPDGRTIVFVSDRGAGAEFDADIFTITPNGGNLRRLTFGATHENYPDWSPDGRLIAFQSDRQGGPGEGVFEIYTMRPDGSHQVPLTLAARGENAGLAAWSPDGRKIAFASDRTGNPEVWTMRADGSRQHNRTRSATSEDLFPDWQPLPAHHRAEEDDD